MESHQRKGGAGIKRHWVTEAINFVNERMPAFKDVFDEACTLRHMLANFDCVVQSPTGSGKTLAFMLPTLQILVQKKLINAGEQGTDTAASSPPPPSAQCCRILALVVAPGRDLVVQLYHLFLPLCTKVGLTALKLHGSGGKQKKKSPKNYMKGNCILICTPGCFEHFLGTEPELKQYLKQLEVLIIDEADRYSDRESMSSLTTLLAALPKQRRTALFSATQSSSIDQLLRFGLRNPMRLHVSADTGEVCTDSTGFGTIGIGEGGSTARRQQQNAEGGEEDNDDGGDHRTSGGVVPSELSIYYLCCPAEMKLLALVKFLRSQKRDKILVFVSTAAQAEYLAMIVPKLLKKHKSGDEEKEQNGTESAEPKEKNGTGIEQAKERTVLSLHRKMEEKRGKVLACFRTTDRCVLFTTDLLARGIDVPNIDWVLQFDIPKLSRLFVHRCGRSARMGRAGRSLLLLMPEEEAYVQFMNNYAGMSMEQCQFESLKEERASQLRERVQQQAIEDRKILELGSAAFVSYIEAYNRHDCQIICKVKDLDIVGIAKAFGLLRMPQIRELRNRPDILSGFQMRTDVRTSEIKFKDEKLEKKRMAMLEQREKQRNEEREAQRVAVRERGKGRDQRRGESGGRRKWGMTARENGGEKAGIRARDNNNNGTGSGRKFRNWDERQRGTSARNNGIGAASKQSKFFGGRRNNRTETGKREDKGGKKRAQMTAVTKRGAVKQQQQQNGGKRRARRAPSEWDQLQREEGLLRKFRRAKLSRAKLDEQMDEGGE